MQASADKKTFHYGFWRLEIERCRFVGGFGHMSWVPTDVYKTAKVDPIYESAASIIEIIESNMKYDQPSL